MKTFEDYYNKKLEEIAKCAKRDKISVEEFLRQNYKKTLSEYREWQLSFYSAKDCHSFWHRECVNKGIECNHCNKFYSIAEWDKMTKKEQKELVG